VAEMKMQDHLGWLLTLKKYRVKLAVLGDLVQLLVPKLFFLNSRVTSAVQTQVTEETAVQSSPLTCGPFPSILPFPR
jgi:hypothetical protein